ncbi:S8 family peptidase [Paraflavitalea soli]|nr:S8 family peptidase [Paraflavitalea soli]
MKKFLTLACLMTICLATRAQYSRYIVQLTNKKGTAHTLTAPATYLSARAIERRTRQHIPIDSTDLPVSAVWLDSLRKIPNVTILNTSKWLNQVLIQTTDANALTKINSYPFVKTAAPLGLRTQGGLDNHRVEQFTETVTPLEPGAIDQTARLTGELTLNYGSNFNQVHIHRGEYLHNHGFTGRGIIMAILDAGFRTYNTNPALDSVRLQNRILGTWDYVNNETSVTEDDTHGLYCFSIIASNRPGQIVGTAPHASFWLLRTEQAGVEYPVEEQYWAAGAEFADSAGADMISSSLGYIDFDDHAFDHSYLQRNGNTSIITRAAGYAARKGMIVMNSAGNNGARTDDLKYVSCPADGDSVVAVGATTSTGAIASFSSWGPNGAGLLKPNIVSVGQSTVFAGLNGAPAAGNGTSFSNPNIAGLIACLWQAFPELNNMQIIDAVQKSAHKYTTPDARFGYGLPDFKKAMVSLVQKQATAGSSFNNCTVDLQWSSKDDTSVVYSITRKLPGESTYTTIKQVPSTSLTFKSNTYTFKDTLTAVTTGLAEYHIVQAIGSDTTFDIGAVQQSINGICFPVNTTRILPSPFNTRFNIVINTPDIITNLGVQITDMQGRLIYKRVLNKPAGYFNWQLYTAGWPGGMYKVTLFNGSKRFFNQRILKLP